MDEALEWEVRKERPKIRRGRKGRGAWEGCSEGQARAPWGPQGRRPGFCTSAAWQLPSVRSAVLRAPSQPVLPGPLWAGHPTRPPSPGKYVLNTYCNNLPSRPSTCLWELGQRLRGEDRAQKWGAGQVGWGTHCRTRPAQTLAVLLGS